MTLGREDHGGDGVVVLTIGRPEARTRIERYRTAEHREGVVAAFREKRRPDYRQPATG